MAKKNTLSRSLFGVTTLILLAQSPNLIQSSFAADTPSSSRGPFSVGGQFGQILPRGPFQNYQMETQTEAPAADEPVSMFEKDQAPNYQPSLSEQLSRPGMSTVNPTGDSPEASAAAPVSKTNAWYKFLDPSLNLTRTLEESERKNLLPIVPIPPAISKEHNKSGEYVHTMILRAKADAEYGAFKTGFGSLFGRSGSIIMVSAGSKTTRIFNVNGYERDVLFKLPNGQIIAIGPGSEMMVSKSLNANELNAADGIARRGFTRAMRCSDLGLAFAQFSLPSLLEVPEFKFFQKNQDPKVTASLQKTADALDSMRGNDGFHKVLTAEEQNIRRQKAKDADKQTQPNRLGSTGAIALAKPVPAQATLSKSVIQLSSSGASKAVPTNKLATAKTNQPQTNTSKTSGLIAKLDTSKRDEVARKAAKERQNVKLEEKTPKQSLLASKPAAENNTKKSGGSWLSNIKNLASDKNDEKEIAAAIPANLPSDVRELLILAEKNEKEARDLRKKAAKNREFSEAYYLSAEQRLHLFVSSKKQNKKATELETIAREAREKASIAGVAKPSVQ